MRFSKGSMLIGILIGGFMGAAVVAFLAANVIEKNNKDIEAFKNLAETQGEALGKCKALVDPLMQHLKANMQRLGQSAPQAAPAQPVPVAPAR